MHYTTLGSTGLPVSRLGLGMAALGRPGYINLRHADDLSADYDPTAMEAHAHTVLDAAWGGGVRYFDAARSYGRGEAFLGSWLQTRALTPDDATVGSKWGYTYTAGWQVEADKHEVKEHSLPVLTRQWDETLAALGRPPHLYQIHSATFASGVLENSAVLDKLAALKSEHGIALGLTLSGADQADVLRQALTIRRDGALLFDAVQATWNLLDPSAGGALAAAHDAGLGVIVKEALANGRLTPRNTDPGFQSRLGRLKEQAARLETTVDALALAAVLAQPWADVALSGAASVAHVESNLAAVAVAWDDEAADALAMLEEPPAMYWAIRASLDWN